MHVNSVLAFIQENLFMGHHSLLKLAYFLPGLMMPNIQIAFAVLSISRTYTFY